VKGNAKIKSVTLGYEDHGCLTCWIHLEQEGSGQGFGGYSLDAPKDGNSYLGTFWIKRLLETVGVSNWDDLKGKYVRVEGEEFGTISGIGHIIENKWFYPQKEIAERFGK
jgi:hypothetical protein